MDLPCFLVFIAVIVGNILLMIFSVHQFSTYKKDSIVDHVRSKSVLRNETRSISSVEPLIPGGHSYCSARATARGPNQNVVSFSFFGHPHDYRLYFFGIAHNAKEIAKVYPHWTMRVYHNMDADHFTWRTFEAMERSFPHVDLCNVSALPVLGNLSDPVPMTWRFLPMWDPSVKQFMSRDLDLYIHPREVDAVKEWLQSDLTFHVMRDNWLQGSAILGGMWGAKRYHDPTLMNSLMKLLLEKSQTRRGRFGDDQDILEQVVWPYFRGKVLQHDSYFCEKFRSYGNMRPFPNRRADQLHLGFRISQPYEYKQKPCPMECRPKNHKSWTFC